MRACIGQNMAKLELAIIISFLVLNYSWELKPGFVLETEIALSTKPKDGIWCIYKPRKTRGL